MLQDKVTALCGIRYCLLVTVSQWLIISGMKDPGSIGTRRVSEF